MNPNEAPSSLLEAMRFFEYPENCHNFMVAMRWPHGVRCAHCESANVGNLVVTMVKSRSKKPDAPRIERRLWNCKDCGKQFTTKTGTIFEDSALQLSIWLPAVWMICNAKNGVSSCELARSLGVTQKNAWHMGHRIRMAMKQGGFVIKGEVEADETFIGGSTEHMSPQRRRAKFAREIKSGKYPKIPVHGLLQRSPEKAGSRVITKALLNIRKEQVMPRVLAHVEPGAQVYTDSLSSYRKLGDTYLHEFVDHSLAYVRDRVHTNGLENFWCLLKRTLGGTYVQVSAKNLDRYLDEQTTRFNERGTNDSERFANTMRRVSGRRLTFRELRAKPEKRKGKRSPPKSET